MASLEKAFLKAKTLFTFLIIINLCNFDYAAFIGTFESLFDNSDPVANVRSLLSEIFDHGNNSNFIHIHSNAMKDEIREFIYHSEKNLIDSIFEHLFRKDFSDKLRKEYIQLLNKFFHERHKSNQLKLQIDNLTLQNTNNILHNQLKFLMINGEPVKKSNLTKHSKNLRKHYEEIDSKIEAFLKSQ